MRRIIYSFALIMIPLITLGQDSAKKSQFYLLADVYYKGFFNNYIQPTPYSQEDSFSDHQYDRFTKKATSGFNAGILYGIRINEQWNFTTGLNYYYRKVLFENDVDTVMIYGFPSSIRNIHNVIKYDYTYNDFAVPVLMQFTKNKLSFYFGADFSLITYKQAHYTYLIDQYGQWSTSDKTIAGIESHFGIYPTIKASYSLKIKNLRVNPFIGLAYGMNEFQSFYIQVGIILPIFKNH